MRVGLVLSPLPLFSIHHTVFKVACLYNTLELMCICSGVTLCFYFDTLFFPCVFCSFIPVFFCSCMFSTCVSLAVLPLTAHTCVPLPSRPNLLSARSSSHMVATPGLCMFCCFLVEGFDFFSNFAWLNYIFLPYLQNTNISQPLKPKCKRTTQATVSPLKKMNNNKKKKQLLICRQTFTLDYAKTRPQTFCLLLFIWT